MISPDWFSTVHQLSLKLVQVPSITGTAGEQAFASHLHAVIAAHPYFQDHPEDVWTEPAPLDPRRRRNVFALVRGSGSQTVMMSGHYDVVSTANYGLLEPFAFDPPALLPRLIALLAQEQPTSDTELALRDLRSGDYLPGRGMLDMKSGLAAGIAVLFHFAAAGPNRRGNLLFIGTPDEEESSHGMRAAAARLPTLTEERGITPLAAINLDSANDRGDGSVGRAIFLGSVGKLLPAVYIVGRETHAGAPFDGINPNLMAAAITRRIECNADLVDIAEGEAAPLPVSLKQVDLKDHYDVTIPGSAWCYFNVLTHRRSPNDVLALMRSTVADACADAAKYLQQQAHRYAGLTAGTTTAPMWQTTVLTYRELKERALQTGGAAAEEALTAVIQQCSDDPATDFPEYTRAILETLWPYCGLQGPAAVICFASLYYPRVLVDKHRPRHARMRRIAERQAAGITAQTGHAISVRPFFSGISDMSFFGCSDSLEELKTMSANTPAWGSRIRYDYRAVQALDLPVINIGPWGRDFHQRTERVNMPYSFGTVPALIWAVTQDLLDDRETDRHEEVGQPLG
ncbi:MAG: M20/M25/M40 family metallo-hydrolase [Herpetosiphon sp.]